MGLECWLSGNHNETIVKQVTGWNGVERRKSFKCFMSPQCRIQFLDFIDSAIVYLDKNNNVEYMNRVACDLFECGIRRCVGKNYKQILEKNKNIFKHIDDFLYLTGLCDKVVKVCMGREIELMNGKQVKHFSNSTPDGGRVCVWRDNTKERAYNNLLDAIAKRIQEK